METESFIPLDALAVTLSLPRSWLRTEADAGRIPCLRVNGRRLFYASAVQEELIRRARCDVNTPAAEPEAEAVGA